MSDEKNHITELLYKQVSFWLSIVAIILGGFIYLTNPVGNNETALKLQDQRITSQRETIDTITKVQQNDVQELKSKITDLESSVNELSENVAVLTAIINERIPK